MTALQFTALWKITHNLPVLGRQLGQSGRKEFVHVFRCDRLLLLLEAGEFENRSFLEPSINLKRRHTSFASSAKAHADRARKQMQAKANFMLEPGNPERAGAVKYNTRKFD